MKPAVIAIATASAEAITDVSPFTAHAHGTPRFRVPAEIPLTTLAAVALTRIRRPA